MAQHDYVIDNQLFPQTRVEINAVLQAILTQNSGPSAPSVFSAGTFWYDTVEQVLKRRNDSNTAWVGVASVDLTPEQIASIIGELGDLATKDTVGVGDLDPAVVGTTELSDGAATLGKLASNSVDATKVIINSQTLDRLVQASANVLLGRRTSSGNVTEVAYTEAGYALLNGSSAPVQRALLGLDWLLSRSLQTPPTLHMRFTGRDRRYYRHTHTGTPIYSANLADVMTLTRATDKAYLDPQQRLRTATSGVATFNYPDGQAGGLQIDPASTNLSLRSQDFSNATWTKTNILSVNATESLAPDNATTFNLVVPDTTNGEHQVSQSHTVVASSLYTASVFVRAGGGYNRLRLQLRGASAIDSLIFDASTGVVLTNPTSTEFGAQRIIHAGITYYRIWLSAISTGTTMHVDINVLDATSTLSFAANGTSGLRLWGAQLERYQLSRYIATTTATVTRNEDQHALTTTQDWFAGTRRFTIYSDVTLRLQTVSSAAALNRMLWSSRRVAGSLNLALSFLGQSLFLIVVGASGTDVLTLGTGLGTLGLNQRLRVALAFDGSNTFHWAVNGTSGTATTVNAGVVDVSLADEFWLGKLYGNTDRSINGEYHELAFFAENLGLATIGDMCR